MIPYPIPRTPAYGFPLWPDWDDEPEEEDNEA